MSNQPKQYDNAADVDVRSLPLRGRGTIGPWCSVGDTGLSEANEQTISWILSTEGALNGSGRNGAVLPGSQASNRPSIQLGITLIDGTAPRRFDSFEPDPFMLLGFTGKTAGEARVFFGSLFGRTSPLESRIPAVAAEIRIYPGAEFLFVVDESFEHGLLSLSPGLYLENIPLPPATIGCTQRGAKSLHVVNTSDEAALAILVGGQPLDADSSQGTSGTEDTESTATSDDTEVLRYFADPESGDSSDSGTADSND